MGRRLVSVASLVVSASLYLGSLDPDASYSISGEAALPGLHVGPDLPLRGLRVPILTRIPPDADPALGSVDLDVGMESWDGFEDLEISLGPCGGQATTTERPISGERWIDASLPFEACDGLECSVTLCLVALADGERDALVDLSLLLRTRFEGPPMQGLDDQDSWIEADGWTLETTWPFEGDAP